MSLRQDLRRIPSSERQAIVRQLRGTVCWYDVHHAYIGVLFSGGILVSVLFVRREKSWVFSGCDSHPATGSLQPVAIGAAVEVTKPSEPSRQRTVQRSGEQAGRNASERRAGLETSNVCADLALAWGRPKPLASMGTVGIGRTTSNPTQRATGVMTTACLYTGINATRETPSGEGS